MLYYKLKEIIKDPLSYHCFVLGALRRLKLRKVHKDGQIFYQYEGGLYSSHLTLGNASSYIKDKALEFCKGKGIDVGAGSWSLPGAMPILNDRDQNALQLSRIKDNSLDFVFSSHCLEHLWDWEKVLKLWISKLKPEAVLFLYLPHSSMKLWNRGGPWVGGHHKWAPSFEKINPFLTTHGMKILDYNPDKDQYWSFYIVAQKQPV